MTQVRIPQRYYHILDHKEVIVDDSNYYTLFHCQHAVDFYIILRDDEQVLCDEPHPHYKMMRVIMTTKAVFVWMPSEDEHIYSVYECSTDEHPHAELLRELPDRLENMFLYYTRDAKYVTKEDIIWQRLFNRIMKATPKKRIKGVKHGE